MPRETGGPTLDEMGINLGESKYKVLRVSKDLSKHGLVFVEGQKPNSIAEINKLGETVREKTPDQIFQETAQQIQKAAKALEKVREMYRIIQDATASAETGSSKSRVRV